MEYVWQFFEEEKLSCVFVESTPNQQTCCICWQKSKANLSCQAMLASLYSKHTSTMQSINVTNQLWIWFSIID